MSVQATLKVLSNQYREKPLKDITQAGFRIYSQNDEDGLLHYIFARIGTTNKVCCEISFAKPEGSNVTNLIVNDGWSGFLVCARNREKRESIEYFDRNLDVLYKPVIQKQWITAENVNEVVHNGLRELYVPDNKIDLLSIDIDGMDYWVWKALDRIRPRVVIIEYHSLLGLDNVVCPYSPDFDRNKGDLEYRSASLPALVALGKGKGYRLVACGRLDLNAIFVEGTLCDSALPEFEIARGLSHPITLRGKAEVGNRLSQYRWVEG